MCSSSEGNEEIQLKCTRSQWYEMEHFHWNAAGETIPYSGNPNEDDQHVKGVGLILSRVASDRWCGLCPLCCCVVKMLGHISC